MQLESDCQLENLLIMKKAFRKSLKRQASLGYFSRSLKEPNKSSSHSVHESTVTPILWNALARKYQFNYPNDWYKIEAHWLDQIEGFQEQPIDCPGRESGMNNAIIRISQCNESYQLCNSLPRSFILPKDLKDVTLINAMSTVIKDHRVPVVSYCCPIEYRRNFIIRCASCASPDQQAKIIETLNQVVKPLKVFHLNTLLPSLQRLESAHRKLRNVCRPSDDTPSNFLSKSGKWLSIVSATLKMVKEISKTLLLEASVLIIEDQDRGWNSIMSSLIQLLLEPHRRTINGLESLISKEWIYLSGGHVNQNKTDLHFILFLDCVYQIYVQNPTRFEFTSEYLRYLFEAQHMFSPIATSDESETRSKSYNIDERSNGLMVRNTTISYDQDCDEDVIGSEFSSYKPSSLSMVDLNFSNNNNINKLNSLDSVHDLEDGYTIYMFNPFFKPDKDTPTIQFHDYIANMKLWSSLYLRWQSKISYGCIEEVFYFELNDNIWQPNKVF